LSFCSVAALPPSDSPPPPPQAGRASANPASRATTWRLAKSGTLGFSFGYLTTDEYKRPDGTREIRGLDLFEISIVAAPANQDTRVLSTKALDEYDHVREEAKRWMFDLLTMPAESKSLSPEPEAESGRNLPITIKSYES